MKNLAINADVHSGDTKSECDAEDQKEKTGADVDQAAQRNKEHQNGEYGDALNPNSMNDVAGN